MAADDSSKSGAIDRYRLAIPEALRQQRIWLLWRFEAARKIGEKPPKIPYYASGARRSGIQGQPEDVAQLATFDQALDAFAKGSYTGLGIAHVAGCGFNSFDFDNCVIGGTIAPEIHDLVYNAGTYAEISPSGQGIRLIAKGNWPSIKRIHEGGYNVECFGESGFVTVTGHVITGEDIRTLPEREANTLKGWLASDNTQTRSRADQLEQVRSLDVVYLKLKSGGWIKKDWADGKVSIRCPFEHEHTSGPGISDTVYFLPNTHGYAAGHFQCLHAHCAHRTDSDFVLAIGFTTANPAAVIRIDSGLFVPAGDFGAAWKPYEYLVKPILQRGHLVSLTGHSNAGKTAIAIRLAFSVASGKPFGHHRVQRGKVVYFAGENADDVRGRFLAIAQDMRLDLPALDEWLYVAPIAFPLAANTASVAVELAKLGEIALQIVDTRAAYASAQDENDNMQALADARAARTLMDMPGKPACLVLNHPPHGAGQDTLRPRGGSAYWGEIDANLTIWNDGAGNISLSYSKLRGQPFEPVNLTLRPYTLQGFAQPDGDPITSIVADVTSDEQAETLDQHARSDEDRLMLVIDQNPDGNLRTWAERAGWPGGKMRVSRLLKQLATDQLVRHYRRHWILTKKGQDELSKGSR